MTAWYTFISESYQIGVGRFSFGTYKTNKNSNFIGNEDSSNSFSVICNNKRILSK